MSSLRTIRIVANPKLDTDKDGTTQSRETLHRAPSTRGAEKAGTAGLRNGFHSKARELRTTDEPSKLQHDFKTLSHLHASP